MRNWNSVSSYRHPMARKKILTSSVLICPVLSPPVCFGYCNDQHRWHCIFRLSERTPKYLVELYLYYSTTYTGEPPQYFCYKALYCKHYYPMMRLFLFQYQAILRIGHQCKSATKNCIFTLLLDLTSCFIMLQNCLYCPNSFCYACVELTFKSQECNFTPLLK